MLSFIERLAGVSHAHALPVYVVLRLVDTYEKLSVQNDELVSRCVHRRMDPVSGKMYHLKTNPPEDETIAARLIQRVVDTEDKIIDQLRHHEINGEAVCKVYAEQLKRVDGERDEEGLSLAIDQAIDQALQVIAAAQNA